MAHRPGGDAPHQRPPSDRQRDLERRWPECHRQVHWDIRSIHRCTPQQTERLPPEQWRRAAAPLLLRTYGAARRAAPTCQPDSDFAAHAARAWKTYLPRRRRHRRMSEPNRSAYR